MLVILEHILTGERFAQYANHLSPQDRPAAKSLLENQRSVLRQRVQNHLEAAYGLEALTPGSLDTTHELELHERFVSLQPGFEPQPPVAAHLAGAMEHLLSQALEHEFPAAPHFEAEIKTSNLQKVYEQVRAATQTETWTGSVVWPTSKPRRRRGGRDGKAKGRVLGFGCVSRSSSGWLEMTTAPCGQREPGNR